ncbi:hypothetical protein SAMN04488021_10538 [Paracoccus aminovorans]|uniref:Hpt domain-containing protein n=1 Tax=Paracoccus aminovorans TaxID=34004 RepID=A0A1I2YN43_9RHOB|nr:hypothetical protein [Paracoccus aminovorans]CQR87482.1 hypothetical protein JCM7685_2942 [Paracoccus aminovorans]SFH27074.1 hypothetical protein SAMN04488021_10538 [Paracoccus aminovorans]
MSKIALLSVNDAIRIDVQRLEQIVRELGEDCAAQVIGAALEELARTLRRTTTAAQQDDLGVVVSSADQLSRLAWQVGLVTLAGVAVDVGACAESRDRIALASTAARLERIGNLSLTRLWDPATDP